MSVAAQCSNRVEMDQVDHYISPLSEHAARCSQCIVRDIENRPKPLAFDEVGVYSLCATKHSHAVGDLRKA